MASFKETFSEVVAMYNDDYQTLTISAASYSQQEAAALFTEWLRRSKLINPEQLEEDWVKFGFWNDGEENRSCWNFGEYNSNTKGAQRIWTYTVV